MNIKIRFCLFFKLYDLPSYTRFSRITNIFGDYSWVHFLKKVLSNGPKLYVLLKVLLNKKFNKESFVSFRSFYLHESFLRKMRKTEHVSTMNGTKCF